MRSLEIALNINGDLSYREIHRGAGLAESLAYSNIWVGESIHFKHPFPVIASIAHETSRIRLGSGIVSYYFNRSLHIRGAFETLVETYGERFAIALAPGDVNSLRESGIEPKKPLKKLRETISDLRESRILVNTQIFVGASGPKMIEAGCELADGLLLNYAHPDYVKWALGHVGKRRFVGVYAPALLTPDARNERAVLMASAFVAAGSNKSFQREFGLEGEANEIRRILGGKQYYLLEEKKDFLMDKFSIAGDEASITKRLNEFKSMGVDQVVLGSPYNYNLEAVKIMGRRV